MLQDCARDELRCTFEIVSHQKINAPSWKTPTEKKHVRRKAALRMGSSGVKKGPGKERMLREQ